jgi:hypothetical protein
VKEWDAADFAAFSDEKVSRIDSLERFLPKCTANASHAHLTSYTCAAKSLHPP